MASYYRGVQPHLRREELYHSGKKGMRWGISNNPLYQAVGNLAKGVLRNGRYVYDYMTGANADRANKEWEGAVQAHNRLYSGQTSSLTKTRAQLEREDQERLRAAAEKKNNARSLRGDLGRTVSDIRSGKAAKNVGNWLNDRRRDVRNAAGNLWDGQAGRGSGKDTRDAYIRYGNRAAKSGDAKKAIKYGEAARKANDAYDRSIVGRLEKAGNWLNERRNEAGNAISGARKKVGAAAKSVRNAVGNAWDGQAGVGSGKSASAGLHNKSKRAFAKGDSKSGTRYERASEKARDAYDRSVVGTAERIGKAAGKRKEQAQQFIDNFFTNIGWKKRKGHSSGTVVSTPRHHKGS